MFHSQFLFYYYGIFFVSVILMLATFLIPYNLFYRDSNVPFKLFILPVIVSILFFSFCMNRDFMSTLKNNYLNECAYERASLLANGTFSDLPNGKSILQGKQIKVLKSSIYPEDKIVKIDDFYFNIENDNNTLKITEVVLNGKVLVFE